MQGTVEWPALIALASAIVFITLAVSGFACWLLWKAWQELSALRAELNTKIETAEAALEGKIIGITKQVETRIEGVDHRLRKVEAEHILGMATRQDFIDFRKAVEIKIDQLRAERREDMRSLHDRLNDFLMVPRIKEPEE